MRFAASHRSPERLDLETGEVVSPLVYDYVTQGGRTSTEVELHLEPFESVFVVFGTSRERPLLTRTGWPGRLELRTKGGPAVATGLAAANGEHTFEARVVGRVASS